MHIICSSQQEIDEDQAELAVTINDTLECENFTEWGCAVT